MSDFDFKLDLVAKAPVVAFAKDLEGRYLFVNETWLKFTGFSSKQVLGKTDAEVFAPDFAAGFVKNDRLVAETGTTVQVEERAPRADGVTAVAVSTKFPLLDASGKIRAVGGIAIDITEKHEAKMALEASEIRYRDLVEHSPEALVVLDVSRGTFIETNANAERFFGMSRAALLQASPIALSPPTQPDGRSSMDAAMAHIGSALAGQFPVFDWLHQAADGQLLPCRIWLARVDLETGPGVRASILDLREIERIRSTLEHTRAQLDAVQDALPQLVVVFEPATGTMAHCNRTYQSLEPTIPLWQAAVDACDRACLKGSARQEVALTTRSGAIRTFLVDVSVFARDSSGAAHRLLLVGSDVTEQRRLDAELRESRRLESLGRLAGGVAHDFNNLLTVILGSAEFLEAKVEGDAEAKSDLAMLIDAAERAQQVTTQLLTFARSKRGHAVAFAIDQKLKESHRFLERLVGEEIDTQLDLGAPEQHILMDRAQFEQVLMNLAANARDAMSPGGRLVISTRLLESDTALDPPSGASVILSFVDSGTGMSRETAQKAFDPFFTTKPTGRGTGLGLSTVHGIVQGAGGKISIDSSEGNGCEVQILLPAVEAATASTDSETSTARRVEATATKGAFAVGTILLVEDNPAVLEVNRRALVDAGYRVSTAQSGETALQLAQDRGPFDLIVTDVVMPGMSGFDLADQLRASHPDQRFVFVSGYAEDVLQDRGLAASDVDVLPKPFSPAQLVEHVSRIIRNFRGD